MPEEAGAGGGCDDDDDDKRRVRMSSVRDGGGRVERGAHVGNYGSRVPTNSFQQWPSSPIAATTTDTSTAPTASFVYPVRSLLTGVQPAHETLASKPTTTNAENNPSLGLGASVGDSSATVAMNVSTVVIEIINVTLKFL